MKSFRFVVVVSLSLMIASSLVLGSGCRKKESTSAGGGGGDMIRLNDLSEIENYKEILRKDQNNLQALVNLGNLYFDNQQDRLAIENYQKALAIDPRNNNVRTDMAVCYRRTGNPDRATDELKKVVSLDPRHAQARYNLGIILLHDKNDVDGAVKAWEALLANVPDYPYRDSIKAEVERLKGMTGGGGMAGGTGAPASSPSGAPGNSGLKFGN
jgi:tetratricopeptide (TPR) repeat protein